MRTHLHVRRNLLVAAGLLALVAAGGGIAAAAASGSAGEDEGEQAITGAALDRAETAALASTGEGTVTGTEVGDEESYYEVEVSLPDGGQVDVQLDRDFTVVGSSQDKEDDGAPAGG